MSSHGDRASSCAGKSGPSKIDNAHNICVQVVPDFGGVEITMSPGRCSNRTHLSLSAMKVR
jgi:hypothetical protein